MARTRRKKEMSPVTAVLLGLLMIVLLISSAVQSCSTSATPSSSDSTQTTDPATPTPTTTPTPKTTPAPASTPLVSFPSGGDSAPQMPANPDEDAWKDVTLLNCSWKTDTYNMVQATVNVRVVNHTASAQLYSIDVGLNNSQGQSVATAPAFAESVPPGSTVTLTGSAYPGGPVPGMRCQVTNVTRVPALTGGPTVDGGLPTEMPLPTEIPLPTLMPMTEPMVTPIPPPVSSGGGISGRLPDADLDPSHIRVPRPDLDLPRIRLSHPKK